MEIILNILLLIVNYELNIGSENLVIKMKALKIKIFFNY